ncbi:MAG: hypothetical protein J5582_09415 [Ruminococcus sp.]|uniref:hypothetical protein n=1 Tax=Ruminococcus sp. TaxID=41978 RepID=UPI0025FF4D68|nr:hypothetical protein [Ruminococcus sp.]MBO4866764.1 hypothetical protein [Ruminococcus sp.]
MEEVKTAVHLCGCTAFICVKCYNAFINNAFGVIKVQQIVAVITVISNVLPAVLDAVADSDSSKNDSKEADKAE